MHFNWWGWDDNDNISLRGNLIIALNYFISINLCNLHAANTGDGTHKVKGEIREG